MSKETIGTLVVVVLKARNLRDKHSFYKQDPYAAVSLNGVTRRTKADIKGGQHPVWDEELRFPVFKESTNLYRDLKVECWSKEPKADDMIGQGKINIEETLTTGEFDDWIQMYEPSGQARGEVYLEMTFYAAGPPPVRRPSKMAPKDRLWRPQQPSPPASTPADKRRSLSPSRPPAQLQPHQPPSSSSAETHSHSSSLSASPAFPVTSPDGKHLVPPGPSSRSPSRSPPKDVNAPLPPVPDQLRPTARPPVQNVPSILRPGGPDVHHSHSSSHKSGSPSPPVPPDDPINARYPSPSAGAGLAASVAASAYPPAPDLYFTTPAQQPAAAPDPYFTTPVQHAQSAASSYGFPMPHTSPPVAPAYSGQYVPRPAEPPEPALPDPYLEVRYHTPLPLPPDSQPHPAALSNVTRDESYLPTPRASDQRAQRPINELELRAKELARLEVEAEQKRRREEERLAEEMARLELEEEEKRRRQEEEDEALAKALDRELNASTAEETRGRTGMPGAW